MSFNIRSFFTKSAPSVIYEFANESDPKIREPMWNYPDLHRKAERSWILQSIFRTLIQETKRPGWFNEFRYKVKCKSCGAEFQEKVDSCEFCDGSDFDKPDPKQLKKANELLKKPNKHRQTFGDMLGSWIYHDLVFDSWYATVGYAPVKSLKTYKPVEIFVEDPRFFRLISDDRGRLGKDEWFCPICFPDQTTDVTQKEGKCKKCGTNLKRTAYVQRINDTVQNRFAVDQAVHGSTYRVFPYKYGNPRLVSVWELVLIIEFMDEWFHDTYKTGKVAKIINFTGYSPDQVQALAKMVKEREQQLGEIDSLTGWNRVQRKLRTLFLGSAAGITVHDIMPDPEKMQAIDFYKMCIQGIAGVYGIQLLFVTQEASKGRSSESAVRIEVQNRTIREIQRDKEETISDQLYPLFGIDDVVFRFGEIEDRDELIDAQIDQIKSNTAIMYVNAGFDVEISDEGDLIVTGKGERQQSGFMRPEGETEAKPKESGATTGLIQGTSTERKPFGPRDPKE